MQADRVKRVGLEGPTCDEADRTAQIAVRSCFVLCIVLIASHSVVAADRYLAVFESGDEAGAAMIDGWTRPGETPRIGGRALFEERDPLRWLVDTRPVAGTPGADFHPALDKSRITRVFPKGTDARIDSYSGFFDNGQRKATGLGDYLKREGVTRVFVLGLATDYCVK